MKQNRTGVIIVIAATIVILYLKFQDLIGYLNNYMFNVQGDSFQSYFNFSYYLRYGSDIRLDAINYPYGEHLHFINSHPLYIYIIDLLGLGNVAALEGVGIINGMILLSIVISAPFIYLILREFKLPQWYAIIVALIIQFNYPHFDRVNGHFEFALAYVLPIYWYLLIQFRKDNKRLLWAGILVFYTVLILLISAYMAVFCASFCLALAIVEAFNNRSNRALFIKKSVSLLAVSLIPLALFLIFIQLTDNVSDRPTNPWGFYSFNANPLSIFLPDTSIIKSILPARMYDYAWEGRAYVGLPATFLALIMTLYFFYQLIKTRKFDLSPFLTNKQLNVYLAAAIIVLLYSMCWPFKWGLQFISDNLPLLKQFRALGRFAWVFYYVFSVFTAYHIYQFYRELRDRRDFKFGAFILMLFVLFQWSFDAGINLRKSNSKKIKPNTQLYRSDAEFLKPFEQTNYTIDDFQAILNLPFTQTNGDKMLFHRAAHTIYTSMAISYHTGLPLIQNVTPRQSFTHSLSSIQLLGQPCIYKSRLDDMNDKHILLVVSNIKLRPIEKAFIKGKELIYQNKEISYYVLPISSLTESYESCQLAYETFKTQYDGAGISASGDMKNTIYVDFEDVNDKSKVSFTGNKAFYSRAGEHNVWTSPLTIDLTKNPYEISYWVYVDSRISGMPNTFIDEIDENDEIIKSHFINLRELHDVHGLWVRGSRRFNLKNNVRYRLRVDGEYISVDDILMRPINDTVIISKENVDLFNNFPFYPKN